MRSKHLTDNQINESIWEPMNPKEVFDLLQGFWGKWWVAGGYAIENFVGESFRGHEDIDVLILRGSVESLKEHLDDWQFYISDLPGKLRFWNEGEKLPDRVHDIWVRKSEDSPWQIQFMVNDHLGNDFLYKRDHSIRLNINGFTISSKEGIPYVSAVFQLLHKAKSKREKDDIDFQKSLPLLSKEDRKTLRDLIKKCYSRNHKWIKDINASL